MAHFTRTQTTATWTVGGGGGYVTLIADWQSLADKVFASINGDRGGCWTPSSPISIATLGLLVSGPASVDYGGTLKTLSGARFILGAGEWPKLGASHLGRTRSLRSDLIARMSTPRYHWCAAPGYIGSIQSIACTVNGASGIEQPKCSIPLRVHDGARLTSATLTFRIPQTRTAAPLAMPRVRIIRTDIDGNPLPMLSVAGGADINGWISMPKPSGGTAWAAGGLAQTFEIPCDQFNVIDVSQYSYFAEIIEEVAALAPLPATGPGKADGILVRERKTAVKVVYETGIAMSGVPAGASAGDPVLVTKQTTPGFNGIWIVGAGTWPNRRFDLDSPDEFAPNFFLLEQTTWTAWELVSPVASSPVTAFGINLDPTVLSGGADITFRRRVPTGNIYHALACHFDSITDMRPQ